MENKFKIGDKIKVIGVQDNNEICLSKIGTIIDIRYSSTLPYAVQFDTHFREGHTCNNRGVAGKCWWYESSKIELLNTKAVELI